MGARTQFRYLSETDCIDAGVLDAARCVEVSEEVFALLADGDYLMGGHSHNSHGLGIVFPRESSFPNMPVAGPDRRFVSMPAYLGGRFDVCGNKWYGSNHANSEKGLPRSVLTLMLNDKDTGEPLALMSANLISSARTGAVPGVAVRHLARPGSRVAAILGCGAINRACFRAIHSQIGGLEKVYCVDLFEEAAASFALWVRIEFGVDAVVEADLETALATADVVSVAASRIAPVAVSYAWFAPGATVLISGPLAADDKFWTRSRIVYDHIGLHEAYVEEASASGDKQAYYDGVIGGPIYRLIDDGRLPAFTKSVALGGIVKGGPGARRSDDEVIAFVTCGMAVFDLAWGHDLYKTAVREGLGAELVLWEEPYKD